MPLAWLNGLGGIVAGVCLAIIGQWGIIGWGFGFMLFSVYGLSLAMLPAMIFAFLAGGAAPWRAGGLGRGGADGAGRARGLVRDAAARCDAQARIGRTGLSAEYVAKLWGSAAAAIAWAVTLAIPTLHPIATAALVLGPYGLVFVASTLALRMPEASIAMRRVARLGRR